MQASTLHQGVWLYQRPVLIDGMRRSGVEHHGVKSPFLFPPRPLAEVTPDHVPRLKNQGAQGPEDTNPELSARVAREIEEAAKNIKR